MEYVVNIEMSNGEGLVFIENLDKEYPIYQRAYIPFIKDDEWAINVIGECETVQSFSDWFYRRPDVKIVSVMLAMVFEKENKVLNLEEDIARELVTLEGKECRTVMRDGVGELIGPGIVKTRVNIWVAKNKVYRAEYF